MYIKLTSTTDYYLEMHYHVGVQRCRINYLDNARFPVTVKYEYLPGQRVHWHDVEAVCTPDGRNIISLLDDGHKRQILNCLVI